VQALGIDYHHVPTPPGGRSTAEVTIRSLLQDRCDVGVLARYMQVLSGDFLAAAAIPFINIHHSFLPAFIGARPYHQAHDRGVKIVGATAHYVTEELDAGPIIEQDVVRVDHRAQVADLARLGADVERSVLLRAVRWHLDDRVLAHGARTVVFERR
jgi:formyltetrahydrofolate deformylase